MRRRRGGGAAPAEPCGVWLDTARLKRGPARSLSTQLKAPARISERKQSPGLLPELSTRQTTIPSFFSTHKDGKDKENSRPTPFTPNKGCKDTGTPLAACSVKILALPQMEGAWEEPCGAEQGLQVSLDSLELQMDSQSPSRAPHGAGGDSWGCSPSQGSEHSGIFTHRNKSPLFPAKTSGRRKPQHRSRARSELSFAGTENTNPAAGAAPRRARGVCCSPRSPLRERGQNSARSQGGFCRELFCQDSQGNRVIAHGDRDGDRDSPQEQLELSSQSLFTQDSEGNRVIKHW